MFNTLSASRNKHFPLYACSGYDEIFNWVIAWHLFTGLQIAGFVY